MVNKPSPPLELLGSTQIRIVQLTYVCICATLRLTLKLLNELEIIIRYLVKFDDLKTLLIENQV